MAYDVEITRLGAKALFDLKGTESDLQDWCGDHLPKFPDTRNTAAERDEIELLWIGPEHWLLLADLSQEAALIAHLKPTEAPVDLSIVQVSDTQCFFSIIGPDAGQILAIACPLDVHPAVFPCNGATFTEVFGLKALVLRRAEGFLVAVEQSFGDMLDDYFSRAME